MDASLLASEMLKYASLLEAELLSCEEHLAGSAENKVISQATYLVRLAEKESHEFFSSDEVA